MGIFKSLKGLSGGFSIALVLGYCFDNYTDAEETYLMALPLYSVF